MTPEERKLRRRVLVYAHQALGAPYMWGGNGPYFDCSGLVCSRCRPFGLIDHIDYGSESLFDLFPKTLYPKAGDLIYYGPDGKVEHVEFIVNSYLTIGAIGGGRRTISPEEASLRPNGAMVQYRRRGSRRDIVGYNDPFAKFFGKAPSVGVA